MPSGVLESLLARFVLLQSLSGSLFQDVEEKYAQAARGNFAGASDNG